MSSCWDNYGVALVVAEQDTRKGSARHAVEELGKANVRVLGAVLNKRTFPIPQEIYDRPRRFSRLQTPRGFLITHRQLNSCLGDAVVSIILPPSVSLSYLLHYSPPQ
jgi:hypothetical protein